MFDHCPLPGFQGTSENHWEMITLALSVTKSKIEEISFDENYLQAIFAANVLFLSVLEERHLINSFRGLKRLAMTVKQMSEVGHLPKLGDRYGSSLAQALSGARKLEHLTIAIHSEEHEAFFLHKISYLQVVFGGCKFSNLKSLSSNDMDSTEDELVNLVKDSTTLEHLYIARHTLRDGRWEILAVRIKAIAQLKYFRVWHATGGLATPYSRVQFSPSPDYMHDFLFGKGENPFSVGILEGIKAQDNSMVQ